MDLKTYQKNRKTETVKEEVTQDDLRKTAQKYEGRSDAELLDEIAKAARSRRQEGTLSDEKLDRFVGDLTPMLNAEQRERLQKAIRLIKGG